MLRQELEQVKSQYAEKETIIQKLLKNGWDINQLANINAQTAQPRDPYIEQLENEVKTTRQQINEIRETINSREQYREIVDFIKNSDDYEYIKAFNYEKYVHELIKNVYNKEKKLLSFDEAASKIEKEIEDFEADRLKVLKTTKKAHALYKFNVDDIKVKKSEGTSEKELLKAIDKKPVSKPEEVANQQQRPQKKLTQAQLIADIAAKYKGY